MPPPPPNNKVAARNNMEVWHDKCLPGSLRVARPGELARKIADIVVDDQDMEPEQVVHTHLCILLAEGDDLELKRPKMFTASTPPSLKHSKSLGTSTDLSVVDKKGGAARAGDAAGAMVGAGGPDDDDGNGPLGAGATQNIAALEVSAFSFVLLWGGGWLAPSFLLSVSMAWLGQCRPRPCSVPVCLDGICCSGGLAIWRWWSSDRQYILPPCARCVAPTAS